MPLCDRSLSAFRRSAKSCLSEALLRLDQNVKQTELAESQADARLDDWLAQWSLRREQLVDQLDQISSRLETLASGSAPRLQLTLVGE
ncbi:MAG: hypothetical protein ACKV0T_27395 [Planctomycetales bacterium]